VEAPLRRSAPQDDVARALLASIRRIVGWDASVALVDRALGRTRQRALEAELAAAHAEIDRLRARLADVTRPPVQFARMRVREAAVDRLVRLRLARRPSASREESFTGR
jgi:hypothetical protein